MLTKEILNLFEKMQIPYLYYILFIPMIPMILLKYKEIMKNIYYIQNLKLDQLKQLNEYAKEINDEYLKDLSSENIKILLFNKLTGIKNSSQKYREKIFYMKRYYPDYSLKYLISISSYIKFENDNYEIPKNNISKIDYLINIITSFVGWFFIGISLLVLILSFIYNISSIKSLSLFIFFFVSGFVYLYMSLNISRAKQFLKNNRN